MMSTGRDIDPPRRAFRRLSGSVAIVLAFVAIEILAALYGGP
jgi:hypothetical protein